MQIDGERLHKSLMELGHIGYSEERGTSRFPFHPEYDAGRDYVQRVMENAGLETSVDRVGNLTGRLRGSGSEVIAIGSHLDTVPDGGMYDGALGVLAGIECLHTLRENGYQSRHTLEIIGFTEEEGNVIGGTFGSRCFTGQPQEESALRQMTAFGLTEADIASSMRSAEDYKCYLELHIEQGGILENAGCSIGIVDGIVAIARYRITVYGVANHAGSTPMYLRDDALVKACRMISRAVELAGEIDPGMTCTVGTLAVEPGAVNVIPDKVVFPIELRCLRTDSIRELVFHFEQEFGSDMDMENFLWQNATIMNPELRRILRNCSENRGLTFKTIPSGAGHDAINMALFTRTAMLFIPSKNGISHSIQEFSCQQDIENGANVLLDALIEIDQKL